MVIAESTLETLVLIRDLEWTIVKQVDSKKVIAANTKYGLRLIESNNTIFWEWEWPIYVHIKDVV